jgi:nucleoside-diphosphate-sugar epimerase
LRFGYRSAMPTALVTGTSTGIGLATAVGLAAAGHRVIGTMRDPGRADALLAAADAAGVEVEVAALDVTDAAASAELVAGLGTIGVLVTPRRTAVTPWRARRNRLRGPTRGRARSAPSSSSTTRRCRRSST